MKTRLIFDHFLLPSYRAMQKQIVYARNPKTRGYAMSEIGRVKQQVAAMIQSDENRGRLERERTISYPMDVWCTYYKSGRAYDHDNALTSVNKFIIDTLVRLGYLPDDTPKYITPHIPKYVHCKKGEERVVVEIG